MPTSDGWSISPILEKVQRIQPRSVLDLGIGFGKYGALLREYLDIAYKRIAPETWKVQIVGVEGFAGYMNPLWSVYDAVEVEDFTEREYKGFDLVLVIDSLEHIERPKGDQFLDKLIEHNRHVIVSCPVTTLEQGAVNGNIYETHRAQWEAEDFQIRGGEIIHCGVCRVAYFRGHLV